MKTIKVPSNHSNIENVPVDKLNVIFGGNLILLSIWCIKQFYCLP